MPVKYIGRESFFHGKSLFQIARNLKNFGEGRLVYRVSFSKRYEEPSYYRLTSVKPDMNAKGYCKGTAAGEKIFRGENFGICNIDVGSKLDWRLIPKEEEHIWLDAAAKCSSKTVKVIPDKLELPPLMKKLFMEDYDVHELDYDGSTFQVERVINKDKFNHAVINRTSTETVTQDSAV
ncbi:Mitochondrial 28S ribosomal protein S34 [Mactra antiquata]